MPEFGLLPFARAALEMTNAVLPPYQSRFSKRQFTQPKLLAISCLMRYEDWTYREAEVRVAETWRPAPGVGQRGYPSRPGGQADQPGHGQSEPSLY